MPDFKPPHGELSQVALWDLLTVQGDETLYSYAVDNKAIFSPEIGAIRVLAGSGRTAQASIAHTNAALGIGKGLI